MWVTKKNKKKHKLSSKIAKNQTKSLILKFILKSKIFFFTFYHAGSPLFNIDFLTLK